MIREANVPALSVPAGVEAHTDVGTAVKKAMTPQT
jgi:hypothetical protein